MNPAVALEAFGRKLDEVFEFLAVEVPRISDEIRETVQTFHTLSSGPVLGNSSELLTATSSLDTHVHQATRAMDGAQRNVRTALAELRPRIAELVLALDHTRTRSHQLRMLALNASLVSQQGGNNMRGFAAATAELIDIAAQQLIDANLVLRVVEGARERFNRLEAAGAEFQRCVDQLHAGPVREALGNILASFDELRTRLATISARLVEANAGICRTMIAIQRQDILRQGLAHVVLIEHERALSNRITAGYGKGQAASEQALEAAVVEKQASQLCADLLSNISAETTGLMREVESGLRLVAEVAQSVDAIISDGRDSDLEGGFSALRCAVDSLGQNLESANAACSGCAGILTDLDQSMRPLPGHLRSFGDRHDQVHSLGITVKRQDARQTGIAGTQAIAEILGDISRGTDVEWKLLVENSMGTRSKLRSLAMQTDAVPRRDADDLSTQLAALEEIADSAARDFCQAVRLMHSVSVRVLRTTEQTQHRLVDLHAEMGRHVPLIEFYRKAVVQAEGFLSEYCVNDSPRPLVSLRIQELANQFTILSHKQMATGTEPVDIDTNVSDSFTLF